MHLKNNMCINKMSTYTDNILGLRILVKPPNTDGDYYIKYEFTDTNWRQQAIHILPEFIGQSNIKIQTLHKFSESHNIFTGAVHNPGNIWLDNYFIKVDDLYSRNIK
jgi:hypothetical protein